MNIKKTIIIVIIAYAVIALMNGFLSSGPTTTPEVIPVARVKEMPKKKHLAGEVVRKNRLVPGMNFEESTFYIGDQEIARQKIVGEKVVETGGEIPDGKVKFFDEYHNTYGEEFYHKGKKHGVADTYYQNGELKSSAEYFLGTLILTKEFYRDGTVRMEENYQDAMEFPDDPNRETGMGKVYFPDGTLKYEWDFVKNNTMNYKKSYNRNGELTLELYYDKNGDLLKR